jgi:cell division septum initiation protein DivIVA
VQGTNGRLQYVPHSPSDLQPLFPITLALRTLRKAERCYFNSDYATTNALLVWLQQTCPGDDEWATVQKRLATLLSQLAQGLSFYGRPRNAVPLADAPTYLSTLNTLQTSGGIVEQDYFHFLDQQKAASERIASLKNQLAGVQSAVAQLTDQMAKAADQQGPVNDAIEKLHLQIEVQYNALIAAETAFQSALAAKVGCETFMALLNGAAAIVTTSADGFADLQKMGTAISGLKGELADLNVIVKQIQTAAKDINSVKSAWTGLAGAIKGGPDAGKIAVEKGDFDQMMQPYLAMPEAQAYVAAMHAYMASVQARNEKLRQSDALVVLQAQIQATIEQKQAESNRVSNLVADQANQDPTLADYVAFMEGAYQDMQALLLRYLFEANAALDYYTLSQADIQVGSPNHALSMGDIASAVAKIATTLPSFINNSDGPRDPFAALNMTLSAAPAGSYSPGGDPFAQFITGTEHTHELPFSVPLDSLPGLYQVTATAFTIAVPGFATTNNQIMIRLRHSGYAPFLDMNGKTVEFSHNQVEVYYAYSVDKQGNSTYVGGGALSDTNYIGLSPCTSWLLSIREAENPGLDLSKVTQVLLSFSGKSRLSQQ